MKAPQAPLRNAGSIHGTSSTRKKKKKRRGWPLRLVIPIAIVIVSMTFYFGCLSVLLFSVVPVEQTKNNIIVRNKSNSTNTCRSNQPVPRPEHGCRVNEHTLIVYCQVKDLRVDVSKIECLHNGGENLRTVVMGRPEEEEYFKYSKGAFLTPTPLNLPKKLHNGKMHYLKDVINAITVETQPCAETRPSLTLFITRYEYVNLFHSMTDFFNAFVMLPKGKPQTNVVFLDAHAKGNLDSVWERLFGKYTFAKRLPKGGVCFENAMFVPPGYSSLLWNVNNLDYEPCPQLLTDFESFVLEAYQLQDVKMIPGRIVIIDRVAYVSHPRSKPIDTGSPSRYIDNFETLKNQLNKMNGTGIQAEVVRLEEMDFGQQIKTIRQAQILIGNHGAGLSHTLFLDNGAHLIEFRKGGLDMFKKFSAWKPNVGYHLTRMVQGNSLSASFIKNEILTIVSDILNHHSNT